MQRLTRKPKSNNQRKPDTKSRPLRPPRKVNPHRAGSSGPVINHPAVKDLLRPSLSFSDIRSNRVIDERKLKLADPQSLSSLSGMMNSNQVYRFRLGGHSTISMAAGVINGFYATDPSSAGSNFPEWTTLSALFSEFKLVEFGIRLTRNFGNALTAVAPLMVATNLGTAAAPGSYAVVADNADASFYCYTETTTRGSAYILRSNHIGWSIVSTPTSTPYAGAPGSIQYYATGSGNSTDVFHVLVWGIYDFTIRV